MSPKQLLFIGASTAVVGGGATGTYFLMSKKKETETANKDTGEVVKKTTLKEALAGVVFLNTKNDTNKANWEKLVDKFHELGDAGTTKINASLAPKSTNPDNKDSNVGLLKVACDTLLAKTEFTDTDREIAKNWCSTTSPLLAEARPDSSVGPQ